jgi:hypothetical protein
MTLRRSRASLLAFHPSNEIVSLEVEFAIDLITLDFALL